MSDELNKKLADIQQKLKAHKGQQNKFGGYSYRSCEDILEAVKPLLGDLTITIKDEVVVLGEGDKQRFYIKATTTMSDGKDSVAVSALAREAEVQKGMSDSQITGSASSYARKYALNGLLLIDDTKDADATNDHGKKPTTESPVKKKAPAKTEAKADTPAKKTGSSFRKSKKPATKADEEEL